MSEKRKMSTKRTGKEEESRRGGGEEICEEGSTQRGQQQERGSSRQVCGQSRESDTDSHAKVCSPDIAGYWGATEAVG